MTKMQHWKDFFFLAQEFKGFGECLSWESSSKVSNTQKQTDGWMTGSKKKEPTATPNEIYFYSWHIFAMKTLLLLPQLCIYKIFINVDTTAANSIGGALSLVCMQSRIIGYYDLSLVNLCFEDPFNVHEYLISHGVLCFIKICIHIITIKLNNPQCYMFKINLQ